MALSSKEQRQLSYFHSLGKSMTESNQNIYESNYKSSHNIRTSDVWADHIDFALTYNAAKNYSINNNAVELHEKVFLSEVYGSNGQAYVYILNGKFKDSTYPIEERGNLVKINNLLQIGPEFISPFISPDDVFNKTTNEPSYGYSVRLFKEDDTEVFLSEGSWTVNYNNGIIYFSEGYTPSDMGWGDIKASFFQYNGSYLDNTLYTMNKDNISSVEFFQNILYFTQNDGDITQIDLNILKDVDGITSRLSHDNNDMTCRDTSSGDTLSCITPLSSNNIIGSSVLVFINGVRVNLDSDDLCDCYFSNDNGLTKKELDNIVFGDYLHWNYNVYGEPVSGYNLSINDKITFTYLVY